MSCYKSIIEKAIILIPLLFSFSCSATQQAHPVIYDIGAFEFEKRLDIYKKIDDRANQLRKSPKHAILKSKSTKVFENEYILELIDRDGDGKADEFAYVPKEGGNTEDFGFIFDLNHDGKIDYIIFNGGLAFTKDFKKGYWMNYHLIDSNYDEKIDIMVYNDIDLDGDGFPDEGITAWIYDTDFNGTIDKAEYFLNGSEKPVEKSGEVFIVRKWTGEKRFSESEKDFFKSINNTLSDINSLLP